MIRAFTGKNSFALNAELKSIIDSAKEEIGDMGIERLDASEKEVDAIIQAVQSLPFLVPKKLVIIDNAQSNLALMDRVEEVVDRTPETVDVILVGPIFDKRKNSFKELKKLTNVKEFAEPRPHELPSWVISQARGLGAKINQSDAVYLVDRVGVNQLLLASEIEKMSLYSLDISRDVIDKLTDQSAQSTVFSLLEAAFKGDSKKALDLYRKQRQQRVEPHYIVAMLTWQLYSLAQAVFADPQTEATLVAIGQSPFSAQKSLVLAQNIDKSDMRKMVTELSNLDMQIKTSAEPDAALELYLINLKR